MKNIIRSVLFLLVILTTCAQDNTAFSGNLDKDYKVTIDKYYNPDEQDNPDSYFNQFLEAYPMYTPAYLDLIQVYRETTQLQKAYAIGEKLLSLYPEEQSYKNLAFILAVQANLVDQAKRHLPDIQANPEVLFYLGFFHYQQKSYQEAIDVLTKATLGQTFFPQAHHFLGMSYLAQKDYAKAVDSFKVTLKMEPNFLLSLEPLGESYLGLGNWQEALKVFRRASSNVRENQRIREKIHNIELEHKVVLEESKTKSKIRKTTAVVPTVSTFSSVASQAVRIGISEKMQGVFLKTGGSYTLCIGSLTETGQAGDIIYVHKKGGKQEDTTAHKSYELKENETFSLRYDANASTTTVFDVVDGAGYFFVRTIDRSYRGSMEIIHFRAGLTLVNILPLEEYLYSVVPSEIPPYWPIEALKAQAVAARTYTLVNMGKYTKRGFDLFGSIISHAYTGVGGESAQTTEAVNATAAQVLYSNHNKAQLLTTYYSANTGGYIDKETTVWNQEGKSDHVEKADKKEDHRSSYLPPDELFAWVKKRPLTYSSWPKMHFGPAFRSVLWISAEDMAYRVGRKKKIGAVKNLKILKRSISGRITKVLVQGTTGSTIISGDLIRSRLGGLRSNLVVIESIVDADGTPSYFIVHSAGWGHGIGMDQSGAAGMAANGYQYKDILTHYYPIAKLASYRGKLSTNS